MNRHSSLVALILLAHFLLLAGSAQTHSPVYSEVAQAPAALSHYQLGRFDLYRVNPPLVHWVVLPALLVQSPETDWSDYDPSPSVRSHWDVGRDFIQVNGDRGVQLYFLPRLSCSVFCLLGGCIVWRWAYLLYGKIASLIALCLWSFSPYVLGHGSTIMPDVPAASMAVAWAYCFWQWLRHPGFFSATVSGIVLGLAILCKFTLLIFYPLAPLLWLWYRLCSSEIYLKKEWARDFLMLIYTFLLSINVVNLGYLYEGSFTPLEDYSFQSALLTGETDREQNIGHSSNRFADTLLGDLPIPFPSNMIQGIDTQRKDFENGLPSYMGGQWSDHGWWYYYAYAFCLKLPAGVWCLVILSIAAFCLSNRTRESLRDGSIIVLTGLGIFLFVSSQTGFSIHSRYAIPSLPFLYIFAGSVGRIFRAEDRSRLTKSTFSVLTLAALLWSILSSLYVYPHSLSYFNELAGGPRQGADYLLDSNLDWGQDLFYLREWLEDHPEVELDGILVHSLYPPEAAGLPAVPRPRPRFQSWEQMSREADLLSEPLSGWYAISVNHLHSKEGYYSYFLNCPPVASVGYSIYIYHVSSECLESGGNLK